MEKLWQRCIFDHLRVEPDEHYFMLTEPPLNPPVRDAAAPLRRRRVAD